MAAKKKARRTRSPHPGVVLIAPKGAYTSWRARYTAPDTRKPVWERLNPLVVGTAEARKDWAVDKAKELARRRLALEGGAPRATGTSLKDAIERYYSAHPHLGARTRTDFKAITGKLLEWATSVGLSSADDVTRARLVAFRGWLVKQPKKSALKAGRRGQRIETEDLRGPVTINSDLRRLHVVLGYLRSAELLPKITGDDLKDALKPLRVTHERKDFLKQGEIKKLLESALKHDVQVFKETRAEHRKGGPTKGSTARYEPIAPFVLGMLLSGMRLNEGLGLDWSTVDLDALNQDGKKAGEIHLRGKAVKTRYWRTVDLDVSPTLRSLLDAMGRKPAGSVFQISKDLAASSAKRLRAEFEAPSRFTWQALRRTCGTFLTNAPGIYGAASAFMSAKRLGHSVTIAEKHYLGLVRGIPREARTLEAAMEIEKVAKRIVKQAASRGRRVSAARDRTANASAAG